MPPLCVHHMQPLCPSIAATVPINYSHCAHQIQPLCPSYANIVLIICSQCAHPVPIKCSHCGHKMQPLCPSNVATVPIKYSHCAPCPPITVPPVRLLSWWPWRLPRWSSVGTGGGAALINNQREPPLSGEQRISSPLLASDQRLFMFTSLGSLPRDQP